MRSMNEKKSMIEHTNWQQLARSSAGIDPSALVKDAVIAVKWTAGQRAGEAPSFFLAQVKRAPGSVGGAGAARPMMIAWMDPVEQRRDGSVWQIDDRFPAEACKLDAVWTATPPVTTTRTSGHRSKQ